MNTTRQPKVVAIGGGTGLSVLLRGLKRYPINITAIVTVADDGGSTGRLRTQFDLPAMGDIRNVIAALSDVEPLVEELFQHRFQSGEGLNGHTLGNLLLAAMSNITGDFAYAVQEISKVFNVRGEVLPSTNDNLVLHAEYVDGTFMSGESKIPIENKVIKKVFITPEDAVPLPRTLKEIQEADLIVLGPGSLFTSIIPNLLIEDIKKELIKSKAKKVYVCNVMTQFGETNNYSASDHIRALYNHVEAPFLDGIIVNNGKIPKELQSLYLKEFAKPVVVDDEILAEFDVEVIKENIVRFDQDVIRHDTWKVSSILVEKYLKLY